MEIRVNEEDQLQLLAELKQLRQQRDELQECCTKLEVERRDLKKIVQRTKKYVPYRHVQLSHEQFRDEERLEKKWIAITSGRE